MHKALGRGLGSLLPKAQNNSAIIAEGTVKISIDKIKPNSYQPRKKFDKTKLEELAESIKQHGLAQPILVNTIKSSDEYELIAGERRWRACKMAGLQTISAIVKQVTNQEKFNIALIENIQREDLNPIEEASAYQRLIEEYKYTQEKLSQTLGKDRSVVANALRLLTLPEEIQNFIADGIISVGHGRMIAGIEDIKKQKDLSHKIIKEKLTVRDIEGLVAHWKAGGLDKKKKSVKVEPEIKTLEEELQRTLGTKVKISGKSKKGKIEIHYFSLNDLERITRILGVKH